ncbi:DNA helicase [Ectothiorhodospiraceae bacterium BW-2]|nr:DNA helicase [Ectothiorhodospiraceae bacterium BW-2]
MPQVAIASDFLTAMMNLPKTQQKKVNQFVNKFRNNPTAAGIHYEKINNAANSLMRSVRIDNSYRGVVLKPEQGELFILLWVDHHDEAYAWARSHQCKIHPATGTIQLYATETILAEHEVTKPSDKPDELAQDATQPIFSDYSNQQLIAIGLPEELLSPIRTLRSLVDLEQLTNRLPSDAYEALYFLADGIPYEEVLDDYTSTQTHIDTDDYSAALEREGSKRRFVLVSDEELEKMLDAPLEKWRIFLHPSQRKLVERDWNGPVRVLGGAGTGKTVAAIHRAKWLVNHLPPSNQKVLFTTFTKNLASDIRDHLALICNHHELQRVEVSNIDAWVYSFLKRNSYSYQIVFPNDSNPARQQCWQLALDVQPAELDLTDRFYEEEWRLVIQAQKITTKQAYIKAKRTGRGTRLNRKERLLVWPVFEEYMLQLSHSNLREMPDAMQDCIQIIEQKSIKPIYSAVIVDEGQDMGKTAYQLLRRVVAEQPNDLFIVGDGHQRIYRNKVVLGQCGINIIGRSRKLRINYRTTEETKKLAVSVLEGVSVDDLDGGGDDNRGYVSLMHGEAPEVINFTNFTEELDAICERIEQLEAAGALLKDICVVARTKDLLNSYAKELEKAGFSTYEILANGSEDRNIKGVRIATMHRVKGLEFQHILIAGANIDKLPLKLTAATTDPVELREHELSERALLHVAMTRAIKSLTITSYGQMSEFINYSIR